MRTRAEGNVIYNGKIMNFNSPREAMDHGFALITEERKANGLFLKGDLTFNTTISNMNHYKNGIALSHDRMVRATAEKIRIMHTKCMGPDDMIANLSGGNQQKVIFGKWLERSPSVFMMDDPTRGIDVGAKYEIYELSLNNSSWFVSLVFTIPARRPLDITPIRLVIPRISGISEETTMIVFPCFAILIISS